MTVYDSEFYRGQMDGSLRSAREVLPFVLSLIGPTSVVDVGCGTGAWLSVVRENEVEDITGIDGEYVDKSLLMMPSDRFVECDLAKPFELARTFDLVMSLEVAEHLPPASARSFVRSLVALGPAILFSAAVPGQGGTNHVNEQWPNYWRDLFQEHEYVLVDCLRRKFWDNVAIACCYRQNMFLFVQQGVVNRYPRLTEVRPLLPLCVVHPEVLGFALSRPPSVRGLARAFPGALCRALHRRWARIFPVSDS
jgi:SAM-dependent methyltransferase